MSPANLQFRICLLSSIMIRVVTLQISECYVTKMWGHNGLIISAHAPGVSGPGLSPGWGHSLCCVVLGPDTLPSQSLSPPRSDGGFQMT